MSKERLKSKFIIFNATQMAMHHFKCPAGTDKVRWIIEKLSQLLGVSDSKLRFLYSKTDQNKRVGLVPDDDRLVIKQGTRSLLEATDQGKLKLFKTERKKERFDQPSLYPYSWVLVAAEEDW